ncbi:hypothetical protein Ddye_030174 [Dipteronia dyeriana]|uniref:Plastid movement impaired 2 n=1 Tax=Dipteronia dyeriana TaxID=168575 RepID=A0AAD9TGI2_9ROSI|nr:hypothetical protein Ddye_030174 [Dipteronia dyeriana]
MGNSLGGKKSTKVMKISGETFKLKTPVKAEEVVKDYPGHVLLESESVKHFGIRAKPLQPHQQLEPKRLYFLVDLPANVSKEKVPRRVRSGINMSAKDRLESLMLSRRSVSDLSIMKPVSSLSEETPPREEAMRRVKMMLPKSQVDKLMKESKNEAEVAEKIVDLCLANKTNSNIGSREVLDEKKTKNGVLLEQQQQQQMHWKASNERNIRQGFKARELVFLPYLLTSTQYMYLMGPTLRIERRTLKSFSAA